MQSLEPPVRHYLNAASGWLELGCLDEAERELARIPQGFRGHPETLLVRWEIAARQREWENACECARAVMQQAPERCDGWVKNAYALHELKRTAEAYESLKQVVDHFPDVSILPYNLACYSCQLGRTADALNWLRRAIAVGSASEILKMAQQDEDLRPVWNELWKLKHA